MEAYIVFYDWKRNNIKNISKNKILYTIISKKENLLRKKSHSGV